MLTTSGVLRALLSTLKSHIFYVIHIATPKHKRCCKFFLILFGGNTGTL
ncbi:hypothetical protein NC651_027070 [Populus alba x Populus x berolinensis]|nr:hypothetical protein NC651_027070 [Populus alba x Populus x berolinensis]